MAIIRSPRQITQSLINYFRVAQPSLSTIDGSVSRDLFINGPAFEMSKLYNALNDVSRTQSLRFSIGSDIDKWAQNIGALRQKGAKATVPGLFLFNSLDADIPIQKGSLVSARNGSTFQVLNNLVVSPVSESSYKAIVSKYKTDLDFLGFTEPYAVEILLEATASGVQGNISKYNLSNTTINGITHITNVKPAGGGKDAESDSAFKNRILAIFSGSNTGTALGYENTIKADTSVIDVQVITPGDPLMTRDGTQVSTPTNSNDTPTIISEGTGGKVDIIVYGRRLQETSDSYIYRDKSNKNDPTNTANDFVLGQIADDAGKTITLKRIDDLTNKTLPAQPVNNIVSVVGSVSGANFAAKIVDSLGRVSGNFDLIEDTGVYAGSPWSQDKIHWISDRISDLPEDKTKLDFNNQDTLTYSDVLEIGTVQQNISITNENSKVVASNRSYIQLNHFPCSSVTRVFNVTTGERYVVTNQNPDGSGNTNVTGRITISGATLPAVSDKLQVDYTWIISYNPYYDYDNKSYSFNIRDVGDAIDWSYSNRVNRERATLATSGSYLLAAVTHPISAVISVNVFEEENSTIQILSGRLAVTLSNTVLSVVSVQRLSDLAELWNTAKNDGAFNGQTIYLPSDTVGSNAEAVVVVYNNTNIYNTSSPGNFTNNSITVVPSATATAGTVVECNYIANVNTILPATLLNNLPALKNYNAFNTNLQTSIGNQPSSNLFSNNSIIKNLRKAPSVLALTLTGLNTISESGGDLNITGTTSAYLQDIVFTASANGLQQDITLAIKSFLGLNSAQSIPSNVKLSRLVKLEKVTTTTSLDVLSVLHNFDILNYALNDNSFSLDEAVLDTSLSKTEIKLPSTSDNLEESISLGDRLRIRCFITISSDSELVSFTKSGTQYTKKIFNTIDSISISSGFTSSAGAVLTITNLNQPTTKSRYKVFYDYLAPKINERITITFNYNKLIGDNTLVLEDVRPINADVILKEDQQILVDVTMYIVISSDFPNSSEEVRQNVADAVTSALNTRSLNAIIDASDLIQTAYTVSGVDRVTIIYFNRTGVFGSVKSIIAQKNQSIIANNVQVIVENR